MGEQDGAAHRIVSLVQRALDPNDELTPSDAVLAVDPRDLVAVLHRRLEPAEGRELFATGLPASPGAASGVVVLSAEEAIAIGADGTPVVLVRRETSADDVIGMQSAQAIVTAHGGMSSHAAVVARGLGIPAVVGAHHIEVLTTSIRAGARTISAGEWISIDGATGEVYAGAADVAEHTTVPELPTLLGWADRLAEHRLVVRANADTPDDAATARAAGALGIGLCRTEHMFFAPERLALLRRILFGGDGGEVEALEALEDMQCQDFERILAVMDGLHVSIRLLDAPLHEFIPSGLERSERAEVNPMLGTRGIRLGVIRPALYRMQVRAVCRAAEARLSDGGSPRAEVLVPMVMDPAEMALARSWLADAIAASPAAPVLHELIHVGAMIETPRAALLAGDIATMTDAISFGTNDLTQMVFGLSRDDTGGEMLTRYLEEGLLPSDPFATIDARGVGQLVTSACQAAREGRPNLSITVCGEHGGDPASIDFLSRSGVNVFSCSPRRVPVARLAVAQALLRRGRAGVIDSAPPAIAEHSFAPASEAMTGDRSLVLHGLRIKGLATAASIGEVVGLDQATAGCALEALAETGATKYIAKRSLWQITPKGRALHDELLARLDDHTRARLQRPYGDFLTLNLEFKQLCTDWQLRDGVPNDHGDAGYDGACVARLTALHDAARPVLVEFAQALPRLGNYEPRLNEAWAAVVAGDTSRFTGVMARSYHDVWMELHQDLLLLLAIERAHEGSY